MSREEAETLLLGAGAAPDADFPLLEAAIACAIHEDPARDPQAARDLGAAGVERLGLRLKQESAEEALAESMAGDLRLAGDLLTYEDPDNADVVAVAERRKGLAVALGVFYLHAARKCALTVQGVDFPGHFLLRIETEEGPLALDPFSEGRVVLPSELTRRALHAGLTPNVADRLDRLMAPVSDRAVLMRLQNTIYARAIQMRDFPRAERAALRRALLDPSDHRPWLDVAAAREGQGALAGSLEALARATELDGGAALAARAQRERVRLQLN
ncbi:MAG TPA: transglutaminase family protein [Phenylobacterium sp.]|jgi:regulator of sirC expression with transglutaminase-like and TPR domain|uniref:SirB1 family protein n=1 Tax=Phenylobacterium sp. TaxID=1871053 RepID=UPI002C0B50B3|nr:transglutaminase family protein [Phenylobacterium sp.]HXA40937.1 transglutaminase family protein [Phenylobacterium sp.]